MDPCTSKATLGKAARWVRGRRQEEEASPHCAPMR